uniref:Pyruvate kinase n=1 Tax=Oryza brachyantha TaxID=4533 RepID=J3N605_ORYBR
MTRGILSDKKTGELFFAQTPQSSVVRPKPAVAEEAVVQTRACHHPPFRITSASSRWLDAIAYALPDFLFQIKGDSISTPQTEKKPNKFLEEEEEGGDPPPPSRSDPRSEERKGGKMHSTNLLLEEPIRMASILEPSKASFFPAMTKIVGTLGPKSRAANPISACLKAGMSVARFDFSWGDAEYHQETLENLKLAIKSTKKLCAVMLDTVGPELQVVNKSEASISLEENGTVVLTPDQGQEASSNVLPINFSGLSKAVKPGATIFVGQYLFTGSETTSVWLEVSEVKGDDVVCVIKNSATLAGSLFTLHCSQIHIDLPTLSDEDKEVIKKWGAPNKIDFLSLSYTRHAEDVRQAREFLSKLGDLSQTQIFAKIENVEGLNHFDEILQEADGIILSRGNLGIDLPPEKVFLFQKSALHKCNMAGKPAVVTRVVDSMTDNLRPTRAEATDVANAVLDGSDAILLGAETLRGLYPVETISIVGKICAEAEKVFNQDLYFKRTVKYVGEPMTHLESIASSAVRAAIKVKASVIICFTSSGRAARLIAKYRPTMPVLSVVIPRLKTNQLRWSFTGAFEARQSLIVRGLFPMLADPRHPAESTSATNESVLKVALDHGKASGVIKSHDRVVVCQKVGDSSVVKIIELDD